MAKPVERISRLVRMFDHEDRRADYVRLDKNERTVPFPRDVIDRLRESVVTDLLTAYPDTIPVIQKLSAFLGILPDYVLLTNGSDAGIKAVFETFIASGDRVLLLSPGYAMFGVYCDMYEAEKVWVEFEAEFSLPPERLLRAITEETRMVLIANPNQPTGTRLEPELLEGVVARSRACGAIVLLDEAYYPFCQDTGMSLLPTYEDLLIARTFSKGWGLAGLRLGYLVGSPENLRQIAKVKSLYDVNAFALAAAACLLDEAERVAAHVAEVVAGRERLRTGLQELGFRPFDSHTNFVMARVPAGVDPAGLVRDLRQAGFLVRGPFSHPALTGCLRMTAGPPDQVAAFLTALGHVLARRGLR